MKKLIAIFITLVLIFSLSISIVACKDGDTNTDPLVGKWVNDRGDYFEFNKDGTGTCADAGYPSKTLEWGFVRGSRFEGIISDYWTYYAVVNNSNQIVIEKVESDSNNKEFFTISKTKYYKVS